MSHGEVVFDVLDALGESLHSIALHQLVQLVRDLYHLLLTIFLLLIPFGVVRASSGKQEGSDLLDEHGEVPGQVNGRLLNLRSLLVLVDQLLALPHLRNDVA